MEQTSVRETLVIHQKLMPGYNPKTFKQHIQCCLFKEHGITHSAKIDYFKLTFGLLSFLKEGKMHVLHTTEY
jgi:hypothetical protein